MKILILANRDIYANFALNLLLPHLTQHRVHLWLSARVGGSRSLPQSLVELRFFEQELFNELLFPALGSESGELRSFSQLASSLVSAPEVCNDINGPPGLARLTELAPDLILSIRYGCILRKEPIAVPARGVLNLHSGLLPHYRGVMATFWAMQARESRIGSTLHWIQDEGIDTGDILATTAFKLDLERSYFANVLEIYHGGCRELAETVARIDQGISLEEARSQREAGNYFSFPDVETLSAFEADGLRLVDVEDVKTLARRYLPG